jgi:TPR repeat protein
MNDLGLLCQFGRGVARDVDAATSWYKKSADLGEPAEMETCGSVSAHT